MGGGRVGPRGCGNRRGGDSFPERAVLPAPPAEVPRVLSLPSEHRGRVWEAASRRAAPISSFSPRRGRRAAAGKAGASKEVSAPPPPAQNTAFQTERGDSGAGGRALALAPAPPGRRTLRPPADAPPPPPPAACTEDPLPSSASQPWAAPQRRQGGSRHSVRQGLAGEEAPRQAASDPAAAPAFPGNCPAGAQPGFHSPLGRALSGLPQGAVVRIKGPKKGSTHRCHCELHRWEMEQAPPGPGRISSPQGGLSRAWGSDAGARQSRGASALPPPLPPSLPPLHQHARLSTGEGTLPPPPPQTRGRPPCSLWQGGGAAPGPVCQRRREACGVCPALPWLGWPGGREQPPPLLPPLPRLLGGPTCHSEEGRQSRSFLRQA
ncbi:translation initiation factor IF-2-like isoform X2 [Hemicordylus capensis]|uniref:translation initiation factor IF-2-like isoform X2 n=1 Tax=Hemicordylus capensis TaxID=884348 RepID=UPI00230482B8|nr:translation initiation factor IF-2-like isoform X2 [Hemicordylus capensis]